MTEKQLRDLLYTTFITAPGMSNTLICNMQDAIEIAVRIAKERGLLAH